MGIDDEQAIPNGSPAKDKKSSDLKLRAMIIIAAAIFSYATLIFGLEYQNTHDPEKWLISSAYYDPTLESFAVNYQDVQKHTAKATVHIRTAEGEVLKLGEFFESQQAFIVRYTIDESTPSPPQSVTFTIQLNDGSIVAKTVDVQVINITQNNEGESTTFTNNGDGKDLLA